MKKVLALLTLIVIVAPLTACSSQKNSTGTSSYNQHKRDKGSYELVLEDKGVYISQKQGPISRLRLIVLMSIYLNQTNPTKIRIRVD